MNNSLRWIIFRQVIQLFHLFKNLEQVSFPTSRVGFANHDITQIVWPQRSACYNSIEYITYGTVVKDNFTIESIHCHNLEKFLKRNGKVWINNPSTN